MSRLVPRLAPAGVLCLALASSALAADPITTTPATSSASSTHLRWGSDDHFLRVSGQINKGLLVYDDGASTLDYWLVDNSHASTRGRIEAFTRSTSGLTLRGMLEAEWTPYSTATVNQDSRGDYDWDTKLLRRTEAWLEHDQLGRLWLGQGSMASDGTRSVDLSGTTVTGDAAVSDLARNQFLRDAATGLLTTTRIVNTFPTSDGLGRLLRVRYDSPSVAGFRLSGSYGIRVVPKRTGDPAWDVALRYRHASSDMTLEAAVGYGVTTIRHNQFNASGSVRFANGFNATVAVGGNNRGRILHRHIYGKLGHIGDWLSIGSTALSVDAFYGRDLDTIGSQSLALGFQAVQNINALRTELYVGARTYDHDASTVNYMNSWGVLSGVRTRF